MAERWNGDDDVVANESLPREGGVLKPVRGEHGHWVKGTPSPNLSGLSKAQRAALLDVREAAKRLTPLALKTLQRIMENPKASASAKVQAAALVLDRAWGKCVQPVSSDPDSPLVVEIIQRVREPKP